MGRIAALIHPFGDLGRSSAVARRETRLATAACILSRWKGDLAILEGEVLDDVFIGWWPGGSGRFAGFRVKIQGCSEVVEGGGGRRARR